MGSGTEGQRNLGTTLKELVSFQSSGGGEISCKRKKWNKLKKTGMTSKKGKREMLRSKLVTKERRMCL